MLFLQLDIPPPPGATWRGALDGIKSKSSKSTTLFFSLPDVAFTPPPRPARGPPRQHTLPVWEPPPPREKAGPFANAGAVAVETAGAGLSAARTSDALRRRPAGGLVPGWSWSSWSGGCRCCRCGMCGGVRTPHQQDQTFSPLPARPPCPPPGSMLGPTRPALPPLASVGSGLWSGMEGRGDQSSHGPSEPLSTAQRSPVRSLGLVAATRTITA